MTGPPPARPDAFTCPICGATSNDPVAVEWGYCGACHDYTGGPVPVTVALVRLMDAATDDAPRRDAPGASAAMTARAARRLPCVRCGNPSAYALIGHLKVPDVWRWIDLCAGCEAWLRNLQTVIADTEMGP